jgi:hypothetical protein
MTSIHKAIMDKLQDELQEAMIDFIPDEDERTGVVKQGDLQGNPDPDDARIAVTIHENDPDSAFGTSSVSAQGNTWVDEVAEIEIGGTTIWKRRFTVKSRCLFVSTQETLIEAQELARMIRERIEDTLLNIRWTGVNSDTGEYVSRGVVGDEITGEMLQAGGPPDAFEYYIKVRFDVHTTKGVTP